MNHKALIREDKRNLSGFEASESTTKHRSVLWYNQCQWKVKLCMLKVNTWGMASVVASISVNLCLIPLGTERRAAEWVKPMGLLVNLKW